MINDHAQPDSVEEFLSRVKTEAKSIPSYKTVSTPNVFLPKPKEKREGPFLIHSKVDPNWCNQFFSKFDMYKTLLRERKLHHHAKGQMKSKEKWRSRILNIKNEEYDFTQDLLSLHQGQYLLLLEYLSEWIDTEGVLSEICCSIFIIFCLLDPLLTADETFLLRNIAYKLKKEINHETEPWINVLLLIVATEFQQKDLHP